MNKFRLTINALAIAIFMVAFASIAQAQATRTWVSGVGDDVNPCSRTAPCKTFAGAISKTASPGEIDCLDPGGFGAVTITKSITIDGTAGAGFGSILSSGVQGVIINALTTDIIHLKNLSINGSGTTLGTNGINYVQADTVSVENCRIFRYSGSGITMTGANVGRLIVRNTNISECAGNGILIAGSSAIANAISIDGSSITRSGNGFRITNRGVAHISNSNLSLNNATGSSAAILTDTAVSAGAIIDLENCQVSFNSVAIQANTNQVARLSNCHITANGNALFFNGGTIASWGNNRIFGNAAGENFASLTPVQQH